MCTVTWLMEADSYTVFFNRDELKTRSHALHPAIKEQNGVRYIAPVDLDGGGTWIGVNEFGLTCGLLNNHRSKFVYNKLTLKALLRNKSAEVC
jgi:uncharacterized protein with NRDE domain